MKRCAGYRRVSTDKQESANQVADMERIAAARDLELVWYTDDGFSGKTTDRPAYARMMEDARLGRIKAVLVWKLDRLGRRTVQLVEDVDRLGKWGCDFISCMDPMWDTSTSMGRFVFQLVASLAELERGQTVERTHAAVKRKRNRAASIGQRATWGKGALATPEQIQAVWALRAEQPPQTLRAIAVVVGLPKSTVADVLRRPRPAQDQAAKAQVPA